METRYAKTHEWVRKEDDTYVIGITDYAQDELGDIVFVELPECGTDYENDQTFGTIESVKAVSDLYAPITGKVLVVNEALNNDAAVVNKDPMGEGWIIKIQTSDPSQFDSLMSEEQYKEFIASL